jgi:hypothetical protein
MFDYLLFDDLLLLFLFFLSNRNKRMNYLQDHNFAIRAFDTEPRTRINISIFLNPIR